jgi:hypothetical protein
MVGQRQQQESGACSAEEIGKRQAPRGERLPGRCEDGRQAAADIQPENETERGSEIERSGVQEAGHQKDDRQSRLAEPDSGRADDERDQRLAAGGGDELAEQFRVADRIGRADDLASGQGTSARGRA